MKPLQNLIVALDLSACDKCLYRFAGYFSDMLKLRRVYFLHVIPETFTHRVPGLQVPQVLSPVSSPVEQVKARLLEEVKRHFKARYWPEIIVEVREGDPLQAVIEKTEDVEADLLLLGKKKCDCGSGITARMIARKVMSSVFFFPEHTRPKFRHILVPFDFSEHAFSALETVCSVWGNQKNVRITWIYVADPRMGAVSSGADDWQDRITAVFKRMCSKKMVEISALTPVVVQNRLHNVAAHILQWAGKNRVDLIVMGAKGHSDVHDLLLGSVAEKMVTLEEKIPVLIIK